MRDRPGEGGCGHAGAFHHQRGGEVYRRTGTEPGQRTAGGAESDRRGSPRRQRCREVPDPAEEALARVPARERAPALPHQHLQRGVPHAAPGELRHTRVLRSERLQLFPRAHHHGQRCGRGGGDVPREHARRQQPAPAGEQRQRGLRAGLLRSRSTPHGERTATGRTSRTRPGQGVHLRSHVPCGEQQHHPPPRRVLDDRARGARSWT